MQVNDFFRITDPLLSFSFLRKSLTESYENENFENNNYGNNLNSNSNLNNFNQNKENSFPYYGKNGINSDNRNNQNNDRDKWTWRPGKKKNKKPMK